MAAIGNNNNNEQKIIIKLIIHSQTLIFIYYIDRMYLTVFSELDNVDWGQL